jgi:hypothetical protein
LHPARQDNRRIAGRRKNVPSIIKFLEAKHDRTCIPTINGDHTPPRQNAGRFDAPFGTLRRREFHYDTGVGTIHILIVKPKVLITCTMDTNVFETTEAQRVEDQRHAGYVNGLKKETK